MQQGIQERQSSVEYVSSSFSFWFEDRSERVSHRERESAFDAILCAYIKAAIPNKPAGTCQYFEFKVAVRREGPRDASADVW